MIKSEQNIRYSVSLLLSMSSRKSCESIAKISGVSGDSLCRILKEKIVTSDSLVRIANNVFKDKKRYLIIDDTLIAKIYSKSIEGACDNYDSSSGRVCRSFCSVTAALTDGETLIPIDQSFWLSAEFAGETYKKKWEIAFELVVRLMKITPIHMLIADGLYATSGFIRACSEIGLPFEMRFHSNRVIEHNGERAQIRDISTLKLKGRRCARTKKAIWKGLYLYFTAVKRVNKHGDATIVYQVSNYKMFARQHVITYGFRWGIEQFFRTAKQHLGLNHCQAKTKKAQNNHLFYAFFAFAVLQVEKIKRRLKNPEEALKRLKRKKYHVVTNLILRSDQIFGVIHA